MLLYDRCSPDRLVRSVLLEDENSQVVWKIESLAGSDLSEFVVGEAANGFQTVVPLEADFRTVRVRPEINDTGPQFFSTAELVRAEALVVGEGRMLTERYWACDTCKR